MRWHIGSMNCGLKSLGSMSLVVLAALFGSSVVCPAQQDDAPPRRPESRRDGDPRPPGPRDGDRPGGPGRPPGLGGPFPGRPPQGFPHPLLMVFDLDLDEQLSVEEIDGAAEVLRKFDRDHDGKLTRAELIPALPFGGPHPPGDGPPGAGPRGEGPPGMGPPGDGPRGFGDFAGRRRGEAEGADPAVVDRIMSRDKNSDGVLGREELPQPMHRLFELGDVDGDEKLSKSEVEQGLLKLPKPTIPPAGVRTDVP